MIVKAPVKQFIVSISSILFLPCLFYCLFFIAKSFANELKTIHLSQQQAQFLDSINRESELALNDIKTQRNKIEALQADYEQHGFVSTQSSDWIINLANTYRYPQFNVSEKNDWHELLLRVDTVPKSLILAQAINESAWGTSRFAKQGNAYFGQRCYVTGCGLKAIHGDFVTKRFISKKASIADYILNLNRHEAYLGFRKVRAQMRSEHRSLNSLTLVKELKEYSERGNAYIKDIIDLIEVLKLQTYDNATGASKKIAKAQ